MLLIATLAGKITLFMKYSSYREGCVLKGVSMLGRTFVERIEGCLTEPSRCKTYVFTVFEV